MLGLWDKSGFKEYWKETLLIYDDLNYTRKAKQRSDLTRKIESVPGKIGFDNLGSYDGDTVTFYYVVQGYEREVVEDYRENLRRELKPGVRLNFIEMVTPHRIDWTSQHMVSRLRNLSEANTATKDKNVTVYNLHSNVQSMDKVKWIENSLEYLAVADKKRRRSLLKSSTMLIITGKKGDLFDDSVVAVEWHAKQMGVKLSRVLYDVQDVVKYFSPFSRVVSNDVVKRLPSQVLTDEVSSRFTTYTQGKLGTKGFYWGTDVYSKFPVIKKVKPNAEAAENWLFTAITGGGKSHLIKVIMLQCGGAGFVLTIMDIEGFEYEPITNFLSHNSRVVVLNMGEGDGSYVDPVSIPPLTGIYELDNTFKDMSVNSTLSIYRAVLGKVYAENTWYETILEDGLSELYKFAGVTDDMSTWANADGLLLHDVYFMFKKMKKDKFNDDPEYLACLNKCISVCSHYFEPDGTRRRTFANRINVRDIIDAEVVRCSFGMAGKSEGAVSDVQMALMQISAANISHQRSVFSKAQGLFNLKIWEEFNRWGDFPGSDKTIGVALTGGRKLGDVNAIITNKPEELLESDRFKILGAITSFCIGAIADSRTRYQLCERLDVPQMLPELTKIFEDSGTIDEDDEDDYKEESEDAPLKYGFLFSLDRNKFGILKVDLPENVRKSDLLRTGVDRRRTRVNATANAEVGTA